MSVAKKTELVEIRPIEMETAIVRIVGDSPLIVHAWSAKARRQMLEKEIGSTKTKAKDIKNPIEDFASSMYWLTPMPTEFTADSISEALKGARFGFPVTGIKQAAISAAYRLGWSKDKMTFRGAFFIKPDVDGYYSGELDIDYDKKKIDIIPNVYRREQLVEIHSDSPLLREDMVRVGNGGADIRYRGEYNNWYADHSLEQILNIINAGGAVCGIGEWRPEKDGQYGMFHVESVS